MFLHHFKADNTTNSELFEFLKYLEGLPRYSINKKIKNPWVKEFYNDLKQNLK